MESGKLDEELNRMSEIVDRLTRNSIVLLNESFAATNEPEGSEIARQITEALLERVIRVLFVTHLYEFARSLYEREIQNAIFLRAERHANGARTFRLLEGEPLQTSYGQDLYDSVLAPERSSGDVAAPALPELNPRTRARTDPSAGWCGDQSLPPISSR